MVKWKGKVNNDRSSNHILQASRTTMLLYISPLLVMLVKEGSSFGEHMMGLHGMS